MTNYTVESVTKALEEAVALKGEDYVYPAAGDACFYSEDAGDLGRVPSCIVGHVIAKLDPEGFRHLAAFEERTNQSRSARTIFTYQPLPGVEQIPDNTTENRAIVSALTAAQSTQDAGNTWGEALEVFRTRLAYVALTD